MTPGAALCVDLDGTLLRSDLLYESLLALLARNPLFALLVPFWLLRGKAYLRMQYVPGDIATLQHAAVTYTSACDAALAGLGTDIVF